MPEQTLLELHMLDLLPPAVLDALRARFGASFDQVGALDRMILSTAMIEGVVNHARMAEICAEHPHDLSLALARLEREEMLLSQGQSRGKVYHLPGAAPVSPEQVFPATFSFGSKGSSSGSSAASSGNSGATSGSDEIMVQAQPASNVAEGVTDATTRDEHGDRKSVV